METGCGLAGAVGVSLAGASAAGGAGLGSLAGTPSVSSSEFQRSDFPGSGIKAGRVKQRTRRAGLIAIYWSCWLAQSQARARVGIARVAQAPSPRRRPDSA